MERIAHYASLMATGIHEVTTGLMVNLTDDQDPDLELVTKEVTIPPLGTPVIPPEDEIDWGDGESCFCIQTFAESPQ